MFPLHCSGFTKGPVTLLQRRNTDKGVRSSCRRAFKHAFQCLCASVLCPPCSKVMDVLTKAAEFLELKLRSPEVEPLQRLFQVVRLELNLDPKNLKQDTLKFWRRIPGLVKVR